MIAAVLADIHGNHTALKAVVDDLPEGIDTVLFLGDLCGYYPFTSQCVEMLKEYNLIGVRGNHDQVLVDAWNAGVAPDEGYCRKYGMALTQTFHAHDHVVRAVVQDLPVKKTIELDGMRIMLVHGSPSKPLEGRIYPDHSDWKETILPTDAHLICLGHTHYAFYRQFGSCIVMNPGSVGQARDGKGAAYALLDTTSRGITFRRVAYNPQAIIEDAKAHTPGLTYLWDVLIR